MSEPAQNAVAVRPPEELSTEKIHEYRARGAHVLIPEARLAQASPFFKWSVNAVNVSPHTDDRDVWQLPGGKKLALSKQALYRIAAAAGISFCGAQIVKAERDYVCVQAKIKKRNGAGEWEYREGTCELDLEVIEEDLYAGLVEKLHKYGKTERYYGPKDAAGCREKAKADTMKIRRYKLQRAETGAYLRAIKAFLPLKGEYDPSELEHNGRPLPFIVAACHLSPDMENPTVRELFRDNVALNIALLSGEAGALQQLSERSGKSVAQLAANQQTYLALTDGEDLDSDPMTDAMAGAIPPDVDLDEEP